VKEIPFLALSKLIFSYPAINRLGLCLAVGFLLCTTSLLAQTERGQYLVGGSIDVSDDFNAGNTNFNFSVSPSFAVFVVKNFAVGANYAITIANARTFDASSGTYTSITSLQTFIGPYLKYYMGKKQLKGMVSFTGGYSGFTALGGGDVISLNGFALHGALGMAYFFNPHISLETAAYIQSQGYQTLYPSTRVGLSVGFFTFLDKKKKE
jgi:hypothetical protein